MLFDLMWVYFGKAFLSSLGMFAGAGIIGGSGYWGYQQLFQRKENYVKDKSRHTHYIGDVGSGKTTKSIVDAIELISKKERYGLLWLDPNGNTIDDLIALVPDWRKEDIVIIDPLDSSPVGINLMPSGEISDADLELVPDDVVNIYKHIFGRNAWGINIEDGIRYATMCVIEYAQKTQSKIDILDPYKFLVSELFRKKVLSLIDNYIVEEFWENYDWGITREDKDTGVMTHKKSTDLKKLLSKLSHPIASRYLLHCLAQENCLDFADAVKNHKIILVKLGGQLGSKNSTLLASIIFTKFIRLILSKTVQVRHYQVFCDEMQRYIAVMGDNIESTLAEIRQFNVGLCLIHQGMFQLEGKTLKDAIGLCGTKNVFRPANKKDAELILDLIECENLSVGKLYRMATGQCLLVEMKGGKITEPKIIKVPYPKFVGTKEEEKAKIKEIKEMSRYKYGTKRCEISARVDEKMRKEIGVVLPQVPILDELPIANVIPMGGKKNDNRKGHKNTSTVGPYEVP